VVVTRIIFVLFVPHNRRRSIGKTRGVKRVAFAFFTFRAR
jgi:hypothetical protein